MPLQGNILHVPCQILPGGKFSVLLGRTWHATNGCFSQHRTLKRVRNYLRQLLQLAAVIRYGESEFRTIGMPLAAVALFLPFLVCAILLVYSASLRLRRIQYSANPECRQNATVNDAIDNVSICERVGLPTIIIAGTNSKRIVAMPSPIEKARIIHSRCRAI